MASASSLGVFATLRKGVQMSPEILVGIWGTLLLAVVAALGRIVVPITVQQTVDSGIMAPGGPDTSRVALLVGAAALVLVVAGLCSALVNVRLFRSTEAGLASLRVRAFRHVHDLSVLTQSTERRGALVSRVTSDVDTISLFVQWGGIMLLVSVLQIGAATLLMAFYSWQLTLLVWACFVPLFLILRPAQGRVNGAYTALRERVGAMLGAISESVVGAETIRAYGVGERTARRVDAAVESTRKGMVRAQVLVSTVFSSGVLVANLVLAVVVVVGTLLGIDGSITAGQLLAFLFLVQLFTGPVQMATEILNELQNAVAGWRRVLAVVETPVQVVDKGAQGVRSPRGPAHVRLEDVRFAYPDGPEVLHGVDLDFPARTSVAVVGATGSGKTTIAKLVTRLMDPTSGAVRLDGVDLRDLSAASLRERVVLVPQEGFLFDGTLAENIAYGVRDTSAGAPGAPDEAGTGETPAQTAARHADRIDAAVAELGLTDWVADLPDGLGSAVGQRGEALSAGERQLVAIARAYLAEADLLVLDEATSAVDPATEVRIARALDSLTAGRSTITIAHRLSTAEAADLVVVVDAGHVVEVGPHAELAAAGGVYASMHASWVAQTR
ncbi:MULTISPECIES: ABC transporter ATP-binding protein [Oerskovia]|uniref:ABC transporter ATP-binding protein n=1 Tax=Oerskovia TaxID=162491 RepID=UPI0006F2CAFA|nr:MULTISPECIES: ABC transporter ATP-binding protein [Oerskovia]KRC32429.1 multidrug ABC transporter ATP-binding protein [Oerskovia sp. Root22]KRD46000.1 multidrug ABC transporter ATP-binding protein [Oerskovia sp. Root918]